MNVSDLMTGPADRLVCAARTVTLARLAEMIARHNVGALPILDENNGLCGVVSERDIVRALALDGHAALTLTAGELMTRAVISCPPTATFEMARKLMLKHGIRHLPVIDEDETLVGVVSQRDLVAAIDLRPRANQAA
jgi:CBS domain-containing protein